MGSTAKPLGTCTVTDCVTQPHSITAENVPQSRHATRVIIAAGGIFNPVLVFLQSTLVPLNHLHSPCKGS